MLIKLGPSMGARQPNPTTMDGGSAGFAGAKTCPAADGLSKVLPIHVSICGTAVRFIDVLIY